MREAKEPVANEKQQAPKNIAVIELAFSIKFSPVISPKPTVVIVVITQ